LREVKLKVNELSDFELGFVVGLIEGEGCVGLQLHSAGGRSKSKHLEIYVSIDNTKKELLEHLQKVLGCGRVYRHMKSSRPDHKEQFCLRVLKQKDQKALLKRILPYLIIKNRVAKLALEYLHLREVTPRGGMRSNRSLREFEIYEEIKLLQ